MSIYTYQAWLNRGQWVLLRIRQDINCAVLRIVKGKLELIEIELFFGCILSWQSTHRTVDSSGMVLPCQDPQQAWPFAEMQA